MNTKVILCYPPQKKYQGFGQEKRWLPLGIASIGAYLKKHIKDIDIVLLDLFHYDMNQAVEEIEKHIDPNKINYVGYTVMTEQRHSVWELAKRIKRENVVNVVGGSHAFCMSEQIRDNYDFIDIIIKGEGEKAWQRLLEQNTKKGIIEGTNIKDLNTLPYAIEGFKLFKNTLNEIEAEAPIVMSRGCTDCCSFCSTTHFWKGYRSRSAENVFGEMLEYEKEYGTTQFKFHDDASTANILEWKKLCRLMLEKNWTFEITARADQFDDELIALLKMAGCIRIAVGIESGSEKLRQAMNKKLDIELAKQNMKKIMANGIELVMLMIVAYAGETDETIQETYELCQEIMPTQANFMPLMILPHTKIYRDCLKWGWIKDEYWLLDRPQPYYTRENSPRKIQSWLIYLNSFREEKKVLICTPVHEEKNIFRLYLEHLRKLKIPKNVRVDKLFYLHNCKNLSDLLQADEKYIEYKNTTSYQKDETTHFWKAENFKDVVNMKNHLLEIAKKGNYDYIFYVDSDLILHPNTLEVLMKANKDMIAEIFWTDWQKNGYGEMPNCWNTDHYSMSEEDLKKWKTVKGNHRVGMTGACTLIKREVFENPVVNWNPIYNSSISVWEDRAFCTRVAVAGHEIHINNEIPAKHLYRESLVDEFIRKGGVYE